jgi:hypothetical protein
MIAISAAPGFAVLEWWLSAGIEVARVLVLFERDLRGVIEPAG